MGGVNSSPSPDRGLGIQLCPRPLLPTPPQFTPLQQGGLGPTRGLGSGQAVGMMPWELAGRAVSRPNKLGLGPGRTRATSKGSEPLVGG